MVVYRRARCGAVANTRVLAGAVALSIFAGLGTAPAMAAPSTAGDDPAFGDSGLTTVGPVSGRGWRLGATMTTLFDENILRAGDGTNIRPGAERADFRFSPIVNAAIGLPVGRQQLFLGGELGRDFYARNTRLDRNRYAIGGGINARVGTRCTGTVAADYSSRQVLVSELAELVPNSQETLTYGATAVCQSAVGLGFGGTIQRIERRNDSLTRQLFDLDSTVFAPQISYARPNLGRFALSGSLNKVRYPERQVLLPDGNLVDDGVNITSARFGYSREVGSRFTVAAGVSYLSAKPQPTTIVVGLTPPTVTDRETFSGPGFDGSLTYRAGARLTATVNASRNVTASANVGAQFQVYQRYGLDLDYKLGSAISLGSGITYDKRDYEGSFTSLEEQTLRVQDKITRVYGQIAYSPVPLYSVSFEVAHQNRDSLPDDFSFASTSALLRLRVNLGRDS